MDDSFFNCVLNDIPSIQLVLRIIMGKEDLVVREVHTQHTVKNLYGRSVCLDVFAADSEEKVYNIEIQRDVKHACAKRARYNSSLLDANITVSGEDYEALPGTYVIFITETDVMNQGLPIYHVERIVTETDRLFGDDSHIIYVNGQYRSDTSLGKLMSDFSCTDPGEMHYGLLAERVRYFKENEEGENAMCRIMDEIREEGREEGRVENQHSIARAMLLDGLPRELIKKYSQLQDSDLDLLLQSAG